MGKQTQISQYIGSIVQATRKDGNVIEGILSFFNWDNKLIHISRFKEYKDKVEVEKGSFIVLNSDEWSNIRITDKTYKNEEE